MAETDQGEKTVERPITTAALRDLARAGLIDELLLNMTHTETPLSAIQAAELIIDAQRNSAERLQREANDLKHLANLSDHPQWQTTVGARAEEVQTNATALITDADKREKDLRQFRGE